MCAPGLSRYLLSYTFESFLYIKQLWCRMTAQWVWPSCVSRESEFRIRQLNTLYAELFLITSYILIFEAVSTANFIPCEIVLQYISASFIPFCADT